MRLGPGGTAAAFARTRRKALAILFADVTGIALTQTRQRYVLQLLKGVSSSSGVVVGVVLVRADPSGHVTTLGFGRTRTTERRNT
jgi:hypothetical protein